MTQSISPTPAGARAVRTNGEGNSTTAHLNLTVDMSGQVAADVEKHDRLATMSFERRQERQGSAQYQRGA